MTVGVRVAARYGAVGMENRRGLRSITFICLHMDHMCLTEPVGTGVPPNGTLRGPSRSEESEAPGTSALPHRRASFTPPHASMIIYGWYRAGWVSMVAQGAVDSNGQFFPSTRW